MAEKPRRIQRKRTKGWRMPPNTVYVGRPTKWGNPFRCNRLLTRQAAKDLYHIATIRFPVPLYRLNNWRHHGGNTAMLVSLAGRVESVLSELRGKNLCCWCPPGQPCHADVLLEIANA